MGPPLLAGGTSPAGDWCQPVSDEEVRSLLTRIEETPPYPVPAWCCDGVHCAGFDIRYAGMWDRMNAVCRQFDQNGQVRPDDTWQEDRFYSMEGLAWKAMN